MGRVARQGYAQQIVAFLIHALSFHRLFRKTGRAVLAIFGDRSEDEV
jgi:hypothetical protein